MTDTSKRLTPPSDDAVGPILCSDFRPDVSDTSDNIDDAAKIQMNQAAGTATIDRAHDQVRWGNSKGLSILEKVEAIPRMRENFNFKL